MCVSVCVCRALKLINWWPNFRLCSFNQPPASIYICICNMHSAFDNRLVSVIVQMKNICNIRINIYIYLCVLLASIVVHNEIEQKEKEANEKNAKKIKIIIIIITWNGIKPFSLKRIYKAVNCIQGTVSSEKKIYANIICLCQKHKMYNNNNWPNIKLYQWSAICEMRQHKWIKAAKIHRTHYLFATKTTKNEKNQYDRMAWKVLRFFFRAVLRCMGQCLIAY